MKKEVRLEVLPRGAEWTGMYYELSQFTLAYSDGERKPLDQFIVDISDQLEQMKKRIEELENK